MKIIVYMIYFFIWFALLIEGISFLVRQKGIMVYGTSAWDLTQAPYGTSLFMGILHLLFPIYFCFRLWIEDDCNILKWFKPSKKQLVYKYINIDLIKPDYHKWRNEIRQRAKNKENLVAYSKKGALEARSKAKILGIEKYFVDFKSKDEVEKDRGW